MQANEKGSAEAYGLDVVVHAEHRWPAGGHGRTARGPCCHAGDREVEPGLAQVDAATPLSLAGDDYNGPAAHEQQPWHL
ncbi:hypothetical protein [Luteitalea sp.]|uniref:hypothetical protein n=1 Tax=Luteitalea sp. TaxID=2004800 RepID=UPI0025BC4F3B|nr:hypothetical protein [Luteitalea sp.]